MKVRLALDSEKYEFEQENEEEAEKVGSMLSNNKGDFLYVNSGKPMCKFQGLNVAEPKTGNMFKFIEDITPIGIDVETVEYGGYYTIREYNSKYVENLRVRVDDQIKTDTFGEEGKLEYNENGILEEVVEEENKITPKDYFYLGPTGGMIYEICNFEGEFFIDIDCRNINDYDKWGREYEVYKKGGIIFVKYTKNTPEGKDYEQLLGIRAQNFSYDLVEEWIKKDYKYSAQRNSLHELYVYRLMKVRVQEGKRIIFGTGFSESEVEEQIYLLEHHFDELEGFDKKINKELIDQKEFKKPLNHNVSIAYRASNSAVYKFLNKEVYKNGFRNNFYAGFPWFTQVWTRDALVGLRSIIERGDVQIAKETLFDYITKINPETGKIKRIFTQDSLESADGVFWLAKRVEDFIFYLDERGMLSENLTLGEIEYVYKKFNEAFGRIVTDDWDRENELLRVAKGDSWMDTIDVEFPLDVQVQLLNFVSSLAILGQMIGKDEEVKRYSEFEQSLKERIKAGYFRGGYLHNEPHEDKVTSNIFMAYYFYPDLFLDYEWEEIFDNSLKRLKTSWGGISTLDWKDPRFEPNYTGENDVSYHHGDSWQWINNMAAIVLNDLNEQKYRSVIKGILLSSTNDILKFGAVGYGSEISSASAQRAEGCLAQLWSSSVYIEMVDKLFGRK